MSDLIDRCPTCNRDNSYYPAEHHMIPKSRGGTETIRICADCHSAIHAAYPNKELEKSFYSLELILSDDKLKKAFAFLSKQEPSRRFRSKRNRKKRR